jgi:hypothetical protein
MKDINKYCSIETARLLFEIADYRGEWDWVKISTFNYKRLALLSNIQSWFRKERGVNILVRHPRGFHGDGMEFDKWCYDIIIRHPDINHNWEGLNLSKSGTYDTYEEALNEGIKDWIRGKIKWD